MSFIVLNNIKFPTLLAISEEEQRKGLMFKSWPPPVMTFIYDSPKENSFWMKNTISALDIVFALNGKIIDIKKGTPLSEEPVAPNDLSDLVIELPHGTCKNHNILAGHEAKLIYSVHGLGKRLAGKYLYESNRSRF